MKINLYPHQEEVLSKIRSGSILYGGVGSGKSITSLAYYFTYECGGKLKPYKEMTHPMDLFIITTARKRDTLEWHKECSKFILSENREDSINGVKVTIDSWNNIQKYTKEKKAFFIFDEQRLVGKGVWVKSFLQIVKHNRWILLSATPGDSWLDYIPVFIANGFYKSRREFLNEHVIFNPYVKFPQVKRYIQTGRLERQRDSILVTMNYIKETTNNQKVIKVKHNKELYGFVIKRRWNPYTNTPIKNISEMCSVLRQITNMHVTRFNALEKIIEEKKKVIVFYNFDYELEALRKFGKDKKIPFTEWNGHKHEPILSGDLWMYLVQYTAGAEGWNCTTTDTIVFFSQNYSFKTMKQAAGRIDRINTPYTNLYYYHLITDSRMDFAIRDALKNKKTFNEKAFLPNFTSREKHML